MVGTATVEGLGEIWILLWESLTGPAEVERADGGDGGGVISWVTGAGFEEAGLCGGCSVCATGWGLDDLRGIPQLAKFSGSQYDEVTCEGSLLKFAMATELVDCILKRISIYVG